jgi:outer membrane protein OmpA-like peptidoglycan-associated protein
MKRQPRILAGTALGLLMACGSAAAMPLHAGSPQIRSIAGHNTAPLILAQGEGSRGAEVLKKRRAERAEKKAREASEEAGREAEKKSEQAERRREKAESDAARKREAEAGAAKKRQAEAAAEKRRRAAEEGARQAEKKQEQAERRREKAESDAARKREAEAGAAKKRQAEAAAEKKRRAERDAAENAARQAEKRSEQAEKRREKAEADAARKAQAARDAAEQAARRRQAESEEASERERRVRRDREIVVEEPRGEDEPRRVRRAREAEERRVRERQARERDDDRDEITESDGEIQERRAQRRLFDSAKERRNARRDREVDEVEIRPLPRNDRDAQRETIARQVRPFIDEDGVRIERRERRRERRPEGAEILREMGDRLILQFGDQVLVESDDRRRLSRGAREVYTEELRNGRTRETIIRPNGTRIVTIRNVYGDVIRRSRFTPDGYEQVLSYVDESDYDRLRDWRDPGLDLPPIRIDIPEDEYILDASGGYGADDYYAFLDQPPVEQVQRLYSVDEVKRSARVRDITRRVDLDTITFEFGSASIAESEIVRLEGLANAMDRMLKENPAETFLIEGHTDAVGSNLANLALSDRRAEAVALALTDVFGLPPENLTTQGYGEEYLKIDTDEPERENRRVAVRRITPLVAPVASAD